MTSSKKARLAPWLAVPAMAGLLAIAGQAWAADAAVPTAPTDPAVDPRDAKIDALQREVEELAAEIQDLKASTSAEVKDVRDTQTKALKALPQITLANGRPTITSADGNSKFALRGVAQLDGAHTNVSPQTATNDIASGTNIRRARLGFDGTVNKVWNIALWGEFGGSNNETPGLNQAYVEYTGFRPLSSADPIRIRVGAWPAPVGLEDATSNTEMTFLERPAVEETVRGLIAGDGREGAGVFWSGPRWYVSGILTGKVVGAPAVPVFDQQEGFITRLAFNPFHGKDYDVHFGGAVVGIIKPADTTAGPLVSKSITLAQQPELKVDSNNTKLVSTGAITADSMTSYSLEGGASVHNFFLAGEWYKIDVSRTAVGVGPSPFDPSFSGWYVLGAWALTGEHRVWSQGNGGFRGVQPAHPFDLAAGNWGAFEIAARYSVFDLNNHAGLAGQPTPLGGIRGGEQKITTVGLNWYPNSVVRFMFDYQTGTVDRLSSTGAPAGEDLNAVSFRSQFAF
jgi:phosphate-selective porin OprO/OprP